VLVTSIPIRWNSSNILNHGRNSNHGTTVGSVKAKQSESIDNSEISQEAGIPTDAESGTNKRDEYVLSETYEDHRSMSGESRSSDNDSNGHSSNDGGHGNSSSAVKVVKVSPNEVTEVMESIRILGPLKSYYEYENYMATLNHILKSYGWDKCI